MRARNIKPGFFLNCELSDLDFSDRLLFIGLWCYADREGRFEWKPKQIKATIFPYDNVDIDKMLCNLMSLHFITRDDNTGYVEHFHKHQHPHPHEAKSILPPKRQQNQCHDMTLLVTKCKADIRIPDTMIEDIRIPSSSQRMTLAGIRDLFREKIGQELGGGVNQDLSLITQNYTAEAIEFAILAAATRHPKPKNPFMYFTKVLEGRDLQTNSDTETYDPAKTYQPGSFYYDLQQAEKGANNAI